MISEFDIIKRFFAAKSKSHADVLTGIGDDAAIVKVPDHHALAVTTDTMVCDKHFFSTAAPFDIGYKSLATNLSDLAAMGATPAWVMLSLTLPAADEAWLQEFSAGFFSLADSYHVELIGGNLTQGPLSITVHAFGFTKPHQALLRSGANVSDLIYVTGTLGDAGLALAWCKHELTLNNKDAAQVCAKLYRPEPRVAIGLQLLSIATAAIDISDGLAADLNHLLKASNVGAKLNVDLLPVSTILNKSVPREKALALALTAGDDYELCFTVPLSKQTQLEQHLSAFACPYTCIGRIVAEPGLLLHHQDGSSYHGTLSGYQHF